MTLDPSAVNGRPLVVLHTAPQPVDRIFTSDALAALNERFQVIDLEQMDDPEQGLDELLPQAFAIVGQPDLPTERVELAGELRALLNVEGNFYPNVDYPACFDRGIHVLGCGPAYAQAVAEYALGLALDLARGISREDRAFREGRERYLGAGNADAVLLRHAGLPVGRHSAAEEHPVAGENGGRRWERRSSDSIGRKSPSSQRIPPFVFGAS